MPDSPPPATAPHPAGPAPWKASETPSRRIGDLGVRCPHRPDVYVARYTPADADSVRRRINFGMDHRCDVPQVVRWTGADWAEATDWDL